MTHYGDALFVFPPVPINFAAHDGATACIRHALTHRHIACRCNAIARPMKHAGVEARSGK